MTHLVCIVLALFGFLGLRVSMLRHRADAPAFARDRAGRRAARAFGYAVLLAALVVSMADAPWRGLIAWFGDLTVGAALCVLVAFPWSGPGRPRAGLTERIRS